MNPYEVEAGIVPEHIEGEVLTQWHYINLRLFLYLYLVDLVQQHTPCRTI